VTLTPGDRAEIAELLARHGHLFDDGEFDRLDLLFTASVRYDVTAFGGGVLQGIEAIRAATLALADRNPVGHHVTNVVLTEQPDGSVRARSKRHRHLCRRDCRLRHVRGRDRPYRRRLADRRAHGRAEACTTSAKPATLLGERVRVRRA
jgi:hypothetical protein